MHSPEPVPSQEMERVVVQKICKHLIPFLAILYTFCILDRGNISIAALQMKPDLKFNDGVYGLGAGVFFLSYFLCEVPSNLIMERVGARRWIARIMITWGAISAALMFVHTPMSFYILRFLLGAAEAGFYPGILLYLTYWVPASGRAKVISRFLSLSAVFGLVGGPLGGQLMRLHGLGLAGWQWLFLIEGLPSVLMGFYVLKLMPDAPSEAKWLSVEEKQWIADSLDEEGKRTERVAHFSWRSALGEPRIMALCLIFILIQTANNAIGAFAPLLIQSRSGTPAWSDTLVATLQAIPALVGAIAMVLAASHSDRTGKRRLHVMLGYLIAGTGYLLCLKMPMATGIIFALSISALGERIAAGSYWTVTTNLMGARAAAGGIAFINSVGNLGGFIGPILMAQLKEHNHGDYSPGILAAGILMLCGALVTFLTLGAPPKNEVPSVEAILPSVEDIAALAQPEQHP